MESLELIRIGALQLADPLNITMVLLGVLLGMGIPLRWMPPHLDMAQHQ